jgi:hypothetical protein
MTLAINYARTSLNLTTGHYPNALGIHSDHETPRGGVAAGELDATSSRR